MHDRWCYLVGVASTPPTKQPQLSATAVDPKVVAKKAAEYEEWFAKLSDEEKALIDGVADVDLAEQRKKQG
jgi:hypothetical protein